MGNTDKPVSICREDFLMIYKDYNSNPEPYFNEELDEEIYIYCFDHPEILVDETVKWITIE